MLPDEPIMIDSIRRKYGNVFGAMDRFHDGAVALLAPEALNTEPPKCGSCVNASAIWVTKNGREIAEALGERLAMVPPRPAEDPEAQLAAFSQPRIAEQISARIDQDLRVSGAEEITAKHRIGKRVVRDGECAYLMPTVVYCESASHPLANREFLFPYASVIEAPLGEIPDLIGPTLAVTVLTEDESFIQALLGSSNVQRLNVGAIPTCQVSWDQPHEGNLFEHLYQ